MVTFRGFDEHPRQLNMRIPPPPPGGGTSQTGQIESDISLQIFQCIVFLITRSNKVTPLQVIQRALRAIEDMDNREPKLRAFVQVNKEEVLKVRVSFTVICHHSPSFVVTCNFRCPKDLPGSLSIIYHHSPSLRNFRCQRYIQSYLKRKL